jgi:hypothetical protein
VLTAGAGAGDSSRHPHCKRSAAADIEMVRIVDINGIDIRPTAVPT